MPPKPKYIPTRSEILQAKAEVQKRWTEETRRKRAGLPIKPEPWTVPVIQFSTTRADGLVADRIG